MSFFQHNTPSSPHLYCLHPTEEEALEKIDIDLLRGLCLTYGVAFPENINPVIKAELLCRVLTAEVLNPRDCGSERDEDCATAVLFNKCFADAPIAQLLFLLRADFIQNHWRAVIIPLERLTPNAGIVEGFLARDHATAAIL